MDQLVPMLFAASLVWALSSWIMSTGIQQYVKAGGLVPTGFKKLLYTLSVYVGIFVGGLCGIFIMHVFPTLPEIVAFVAFVICAYFGGRFAERMFFSRYQRSRSCS